MSDIHSMWKWDVQCYKLFIEEKPQEVTEDWKINHFSQFEDNQKQCWQPNAAWVEKQ